MSFKIGSSLFLLLLLLATTPALAQTDVVARAPSARVARPWALSFALTGYGEVPLAGLELGYHLTDRFAIAARATTLLLIGDVSLTARTFLTAQPTGGWYVDAGAHAIGAVMGGSALGGSAELGYEYRSAGGFTVAASGGLTVASAEGCGCGRPPESHVTAAPTFNLRIGHAF